MGLRVNPTQRQRRLGLELRRLREEQGLTATKAGAVAGLSAAHLNHIEAGRTAIAPAKLAALLDLYGCKQEVAGGLTALSQATGRGWWSEYRRPPLEDRAADLAELESLSVRHRSFQWMQVPGLLQTAEYMRALFTIGHPEAPAETIERFVDFRLRRQHLLTEGSAPPEFHAVIHEAAFRMEFAGRDIMERQIEHVVEMARLPHVTVQILPFKSDFHRVHFSSPFVVYDAAAPELSTVYVEHPARSPFITDQDNLRHFSEAFTKLSAVALPAIDHEAARSIPIRRDSLGLLQRVLYDL
jgi:transcriptional regulator with XRE-family HTH domain